MKKEEFLRQLEYLLQDIPEDDKRDAIDYYRDYLEEAGPEQEEAVLEEFGSPERIASVIRTDLLGGMESAGEFTDNGYDDRRFRTSAYPAVNDGKTAGSAEQDNGGQDGEQKKNCHSGSGSTGNKQGYRANSGRNNYRQGSYGQAGYGQGSGRGTDGNGNYEKGSYAGKSQGNPSNDSKWWKYLLIALGILFIGPFALAAVFGAAGTATGFVVVLATVLLVLAILTIAGILGGVAMVIAGIMQLFGGFWSGVMSIGLGLVFGGAGCLLLCCSWLFYGRFLPWAVMGIVHFVEKLMHRDSGNSGRKTGI
ncbi:HAAS signaling domain-containing protein [Clostridium transplantifaecale]|uniref:HAAS signaling domain-containing protein n=1 Tax=Clostridium transplantifaecale TaxID=2479838 RepID=UPI000F631A34|nr:DUF1700 domain-containing protein [Clostridium transplantifaecale]